MAIKRISKLVTTDAAGAADVDTAQFQGKIISVEYEKDDYADTVDFTITLKTQAIGLWTEANVTAAKTVHPTVLTQDQVGVDATARDYLFAVGEPVRIVLASGGDTKSGTFRVVYDDLGGPNPY